jgi:cytosine/adenosine deaminase-related metal-dependent hydrolase
MELINETKSWLTHQPRSNMNNAVGMAEIEKMDRMGIPVCLGNDGFSNAMLEEWRTCYLAHKLWQKNPQAMNGSLVVKIGAQNNGQLVSHLFDDQKVGKIATSYKADLILVDYSPITDLNENNIPWHILFGFRDSMITHTMVAGKWLMVDRRLVDLDENEVHQKALELSRGVWKRYAKKF